MPNDTTLEERINSFLSRAKLDKDSGYCGGCAYYETMLPAFLSSEVERGKGEERHYWQTRISEELTNAEIDLDNPKNVFTQIIYENFAVDNVPKLVNGVLNDLRLKLLTPQSSK